MQHELENNSRLKKKINNAVTPILQKRRSLVRAVASAAAVGGKRMMQVSTLTHLFCFLFHFRELTEQCSKDRTTFIVKKNQRNSDSDKTC